MCDLLLKNGYPVDYILFTDTLQEHKKMYIYIEKLKEYFKSRYSKEITVLKPKSTFEDWCFGKIGKGERKGLVRGLPSLANGFCYWRRESKVKPMDEFSGQFENVTYYIGYTKGENRTVEDNGKFKYLFPLKDNFKMTEDDCKKYLIDQEMENPLYKDFSRTGCVMCPFQSDQSFYQLYKKYPDTWEYMKKIEKELSETKDVVSPFWFMYFKTCEDKEKEFDLRSDSLFDFSDEPLKDCFCKI